MTNLQTTKKKSSVHLLYKKDEQICKQEDKCNIKEWCACKWRQNII